MKYIKSPIRQEGSKYSYLDELYSYFPEHDIYIEPFCGTGVVAINNHKPKVKLLNDHNKIIYWMFMILSTRRGKEELVKALNSTPVYYEAIRSIHLGRGRLVDKIAKIIILSKISFLDQGSTLRLSYTSEDLYNDVELFHRSYVYKCKWTNKDFRAFLKSMQFRSSSEEKRSFVYCNPPYVMEKGGLKSNNGFGVTEMEELLKLLQSKNWKFAISCRQDSASFWKSKGLFVEQIAKVNVGFKSKLNEYEYLAMNYRIQPELFED